MSAPVSPDPQYAPECEKRFAVVIYGGVSLAIYINGIVQEMLALVRATAPATAGANEGRPLLSGRLTGSEKVYRKLGQLLGPDANGDLQTTWGQIQADAPLPIRTRFVIDVLSGTSAGGINAMFLAKALAANAPLRKLQTLWQEEGDIAKLINDKRSLEPSLRGQKPPQSLLNSQRMYLKLLEALDGMDKDPEDTPGEIKSPLVEALDLFSTTTDIAGLVLPVTLADKVVDERRHRNVFHFRYDTMRAETLNDFGRGNNPFLAYAARCTSAFPFAFEPMALCDIFPVLRASAYHSRQSYCDPGTLAWQKFYVDYIGDGQPARRSQPFQLRPFGDGGYLDNKPFSYAIDTLIKRHADLPVDRKLVYIEPSPERLRGDTFEDGRPDAIENSIAALLTLPRYEAIRQDLEVVVQRNVEVERITRVVEEILNEIEATPAGLEAFAPASGKDADPWLQGGSDKWGARYLTYEKLKLTTVTDNLADLLSREFAIDAHSALGAGVRVIAQVWRERHFPTEKGTREFLLKYDVEYRLRRFRHVWRAINRLHRDASGDAAFVEAYRGELKKIKASLQAPYLSLKELLERAGIDPSKTSVVLLKEAEMKLVMEPPAAEQLESWPGLAQCAGFRDSGPVGRKIRAAYVLDRVPEGAKLSREKPLTDLADLLAGRFEERLKKASDTARAAFAVQGDPTTAENRARQAVKEAYESFERYDSTAFPIMFGTNVGECDRIDVHRISPDDAEVTKERFGSLAKVRGQALAAFGAFLDAEWRKNDILLGRLHGAERLVTMLLPGRDAATTAIRKSLIAEAHAEITVDFLDLALVGRAGFWEADTKKFFESVQDQPSPELTAKSATRASAVTASLLEGITDARHLRGQKWFRYMGLLSRFLFLFVEISVPHSVWALFGKYWLQLLALFALMLVVIAVFVGGAVVKVAVAASVAVVVLYIARDWLRRYLGGQTNTSPASAMAITSIVVVAITAGVFWWPDLREWLAQGSELVRAKIASRLPAPGNASSYTPQGFARAFLIAASSVLLLTAAVLWRAMRRIPPASSFVVPAVAAATPASKLDAPAALSAAWRGTSKATRAAAAAMEMGGKALGRMAATANLRAHGAVHPLRGMQGAMTEADVVAAVGRYDVGTRMGVAAAIRADFGFAAAYALLFAAIGVHYAIAGRPAAILIGVLGIAAAICDAQENSAVLAALKKIPEFDPKTPDKPLSPSPYYYSRLKWLFAAAATAAAVGFIVS